MESVTEKTCADFVYFRKLLLDARKLDDNINHHLNNMKQPEKQCVELKREMENLFQTRLLNIKKCIEYYKYAESTKFLLKKEVITFITICRLICWNLNLLWKKYYKAVAGKFCTKNVAKINKKHFTPPCPSELYK